MLLPPLSNARSTNRRIIQGTIKRNVRSHFGRKTDIISRSKSGGSTRRGTDKTMGSDNQSFCIIPVKFYNPHMRLSCSFISNLIRYTVTWHDSNENQVPTQQLEVPKHLHGRYSIAVFHFWSNMVFKLVQCAYFAFCLKTLGC